MNVARMLTPVEVLRITAHILAESHSYPIALRKKVVRESQSLHRLMTGSLKAERGVKVLTLRKPH